MLWRVLSIHKLFLGLWLFQSRLFHLSVHSITLLSIALLSIFVVSKVTDDIKEVINYHIALQEGVSDLERLPISSRLIKNLHKTLLGGGVRGGGKTPGECRTIQNYIGTQGCTVENASYIPPEPQLVDSYMSNLEKFINEDDETNDLIKIALIHSQFETIHPFLDGNGRIGRILIPLYLYNKGFISSANLFVSESLEKDKYKYYSLLNSTRVIITDKEDDVEQYKKDIAVARKIYSDEKPRNRKYYFYDLISILR